MKKIPFLFLFFLCFSFFLQPVFGQKIFSKTIGAADVDEGYRSLRTPDGGFAMIGYSTGIGIGKKGLLSKYNTNGDLVWAKTLGYLAQEQFYNLSATSDGGFITCGEGKYCVNFNCGTDAFITKLDANGGIQWMKGFGGIAWDGGIEVKQLSDGGYILLGETVSYGQGNYDMFLIRTDANGDTLWTKTYGSVGVMYGEDKAAKVEQTADGGFLVLGSYYFGDDSGSNNQYHAVLMKTDGNGNLTWAKALKSIGSINKGYGMCKLPAGGYAILTMYYVVIVDNNGNITTSKQLPSGFSTFGGQNIHSDISLANDGNLFVAGGHNGDGCLLKLNTAGEILWAKTYGTGGTTQYDYFANAVQIPDGRIVVTGSSTSLSPSGTSDQWLLLTDEKGEIPGCFTPQTLTQNIYTITAETVTPLSTSGFMISTITSGTSEDASTTTTLTTPCEASYTVGLEEMTNFGGVLFPIPAQTVLTLTLANTPLNKYTCYDIQGRAVFLPFIENTAESRYQWDVSALPKGVFLLKLETDKGIISERFIKE